MRVLICGFSFFKNENIKNQKAWSYIGINIYIHIIQHKYGLASVHKENQIKRVTKVQLSKKVKMFIHLNIEINKQNLFYLLNEELGTEKG